MITQLDNNQRVFQLIDDNENAFFCNLSQVKQTIESKAIVRMYYFWNNKPKLIGLNAMNEMLKKNQLQTAVKS